MAKETEQSILLEEIVDQFTRRFRAGEHPSIAEYQELHPQLKHEIEDLLASVAMIEQLKSNPAQTRADGPSLDEVSHLKQIGDYQVMGEIGRGGMGVVFEAVHQSLGRRVAIKVMPTPTLNRAQYVERFKREAQAAARMHHTNIVSVFGVGEGQGFHYYVMDFVDGQTLSEIVRGLSSTISDDTTKINSATRLALLENGSPQKKSDQVADSTGHTHIGDETSIGATQPFSGSTSPDSADSKTASPTTPDLSPQHFRWAARIGANIADALAYAHESNVLHRDIKPSNIILDRKGVVWITDFGLAKDATNEINLTKTGDVIGTPQYLAPESLEGKYDHRSEVYCLGLTLYELAMLQPAYKNGTTAEVIGAIAMSSPVSPRKISRQIPIDFSTIIDKAVSRDPKLRYQSAHEMQKDLLAFVEDRPIAARPPSTLENVVKWSRRNPLPAALSVVSALLLTLVAVSATIGYLSTMDALEKEANKSAKLFSQQKETERQKQVAVSERIKMQTQYDRAEGNIAITLQAFDEMFKQVVRRGSSTRDEIQLDGFDELIGIETSITTEDAAFLDKLLVFYDQFANQNADNDALRIESARAFRRVANIYQLIGDGPKAVKAYYQSIKGYEESLKLSPDSKEILIALVNTKSEISSLLLRTKEGREAIAQTRSAIKLLERVPVEQLDNELKLELARTYNSLGASLALISSFERSSFERIRPEILEELAKVIRPRRGPNGRRPPENRRPTGNSNRNQNSQPNGRRPDSRPDPLHRIAEFSNTYSRRAIDILNELIESDPNNQEYLFVRANSYCSLAALSRKPYPKQSVEYRDQAIAELKSLISKDQDNPELQYRLAVACSLSNQDNTSSDEKKLVIKSVKIADDLASRFPQFLDYHFLLVSVRVRYADQLMKMGELEEALNAIIVCKSSLERIKSLSSTDRSNKAKSAMALFSQLGKLEKQAEKSGESELARKARVFLNQIRKRDDGRRKFSPGRSGNY